MGLHPIIAAKISLYARNVGLKNSGISSATTLPFKALAIGFEAMFPLASSASPLHASYALVLQPWTLRSHAQAVGR